MEGSGKKRRPAGAAGVEVSSSTLKPWLKWSDSLQSLLEDGTGSELFEQYLQQEGVSSQLDFIYAVDGLKSTANDDEPITLSQKIRSILCLSQVLIGISSSTRDSLNTFYKESTKHLYVDVTIFDKAVQEVESHMRTNLYPNFLKSDIYINCIANYTSTDPNSITLQTVQEDSELVVKRPGLTKKALEERWWRDEQKLRNVSIHGSSGAGNPYHAGYSPFITVSRQDSEIQSLSSGANTEHRFPVMKVMPFRDRDRPSTSKSRATGSSSRHKQPQQQVDDVVDIVQINCRRQNDPHINKGQVAENDPEKFFSLLLQKLTLVAEREAKGLERIFSSATPRMESPEAHLAHPRAIAEALRALKEQTSEQAEDILEEHFSRVFDKTPDGRPSPPNQMSKSPLIGKPKQFHIGRKHGHHIKKPDDTDSGAFSSHQSRTPGYEDVFAASGATGVGPSARVTRRHQRSEIVDSGISVVSSSVAPFSRVTSSASAGSIVPLPGDHFWRTGRGGNGNGNGSSSSKVIPAIIFYEDDPKGVPYAFKLPLSKVTLGILKEHLPRRGPFRYFFKRHSSSVEGSVVQEEITRDDQTLPLFEGKLVATLKCT